ncbi:MAG: hypothetical protein H8D56_05915 [Planctomycetes bacterium]|nr:hypothetical protein [Planctomycetota bacterium]
MIEHDISRFTMSIIMRRESVQSGKERAVRCRFQARRMADVLSMAVQVSDVFIDC